MLRGCGARGAGQEPPLRPPRPRAGGPAGCTAPFAFVSPCGASPSPAQLSPARHSPAHLSPARHGTPRHSSAQHGSARHGSAQPCRGSAWRRPGCGGISSCSSCGTRAGSRRAGGTRCGASTTRSFGSGESPRPDPGSIAWDGLPSQHHPFPWPASPVPGQDHWTLASTAGASRGVSSELQTGAGCEGSTGEQVGASGALLHHLLGWDGGACAFRAVRTTWTS